MCHLLRGAVALQRDPSAGELPPGLVGDHLRHAGLDGARPHGVDRDAGFAQLHGQRAGQADHPVLGRRVWRDTGRAPHALRGRDVDDAARRRGPEVRQRRPDGPGLGGQHHVHGNQPGVLVSRIVDRSTDRHPGVVDQHVQPTAPGGDLGHHGIDGRPVGHVQRPAPRPSAGAFDLGHHGGHPPGVAVGHGHDRSLVGEQVRRGPPDPRTGPGDQHHVASHRPAEAAQPGGWQRFGGVVLLLVHGPSLAWSRGPHPAGAGHDGGRRDRTGCPVFA